MLAMNPTFRKRRVKQEVRSSAQVRHEVRRSMVNNAQIPVHCNSHGKERPTLVTPEGPMKSPPELVTPKIGHDRSDENEHILPYRRKRTTADAGASTKHGGKGGGMGGPTFPAPWKR